MVELATIIHSAVLANPSQFGLSQDVVGKMTVDGIKAELYAFLNGKDTGVFTAKIFDGVFRELIKRGLVKNRMGETLTLFDYEHGGYPTKGEPT